MDFIYSSNFWFLILINNFCRSESRTAVLIVHERPTVSLNPSGALELEEGDQLELVCSARGNPQPSIVWDKLNQYR